MSDPSDPVTLYEVIRLFDDEYMVVHDETSLSVLRELLDPRTHHSLQQFNEQTDEEFLETWLTFVRLIDAEFDICRHHLKRRLKALDLVQQIQAVDDVEQARQIAETYMDVKRLRADLAETTKASRKRIDPSRYYSYDEAAEAVGVSVSTLRRQARDGKLKKTMIRERVKFMGSDLLAFQRERGDDLRILGDP
jgi:excisionase family DNA binding protein